MKKMIAVWMILMTGITVMSWGQADLRKKIEVTGMAERTLQPDQIFVNITLKEYKNGSRIVEMDRLEDGLVKALRKLDIDDDKLTVENMYGYNWDWRKKRTDDFLASKSFRLELPDLKKMNDLVEYLDPEGVSSIGIAEVKHTREEEIREELATEALQQAREKAIKLLASIDEELGGVLEVRTSQYVQPYPKRMEARMYNAAADDSGYTSDVEFRNIDIQVEISAVFEIK